MAEPAVHVSLVVPDLHKESSGITPALVNFANAIHNAGAMTALYTLSPTPDPLPSLDHHIPLQVFRRSRLLPRLGLSAGMKASIKKLSLQPGILHNHSLWMMPNILAGCYCRPDSRAKLVVSPHGTMSAWALSRSRVNKLLAWHILGQKQILQHAALFHATSRHEVQDIRAAGYKGPIALIPYGITLPPLDKSNNAIGGKRTLLYLSRIHPGKGIDILLQAWCRLAGRFPDWHLHVVGPLNNTYARKMQQFARDLDLPRVEFLGECRGDAKRACIQSAELFVLPSLSESFGFAIAEALAHGLPVITTEGTPWQDLLKRDCGWYCQADVDSLERTMNAALQVDAVTLAHMGARGRAWMQESHDWSRVGRDILATYRWLLGQADRPAHVLSD